MDKMFIIPHTHYDCEVFQKREEYLPEGFSILTDVLAALNTNDDFRYNIGQSALVRPFLESNPELADNFKEMVNNGKLEIVCGMYTMADVNIPSGEALVRQFQAGKEYYKKALGVDVITGWTIDSFGHQPQMPQILLKSGFKYFSFSRAAEESCSEFYWKGIDGSEILCHWMALHYNITDISDILIHFTNSIESAYKKLKGYASTDIVFMPQGGDFAHPAGHLGHMVDEYNKLPDKIVELKIATPKEFFEELEKYKDKIGRVDRDFNPLFQGCYSSRIEVKQQNRYMENLLYTAELFSALNLKSEKKLIDSAWEPVLFNQFHDIICGCHSDEVFDDVMTRYKHSGLLAKEILKENIEELIENIDTSGDGIPIVIFNQLNWERSDIVSTSVSYADTGVFDIILVNSENETIPFKFNGIEHYHDGSIKKANISFIAKAPSIGYEVYRVIPKSEARKKAKMDEHPAAVDIYGITRLKDGMVENEFYKIEFDLWKGNIKSIILKETNEEFVNTEIPLFNTIIKENDYGDYWENNAPLRPAASRTVNRVSPIPEKGCAEFSVDFGGYGDIENGDIRSDFVFSANSKFGKISTVVSIYKGLKRIDISTGLVNHDEYVRYRIAFPANIKGGEIVNEIPFGCIKRPEGEFPAQNWIDYSDSKKGLALLNCGIPGNAAVDDTLLLSVLKCVIMGEYGYDPNARTGRGFEKGINHSFKYALIPHKGNWKDAELYKHGLELNNPLIVQKTTAKKGPLTPEKSFISIDKSNVIVTNIKRMDESIFIRLYEAAGDSSNVRLVTGWQLNSVTEVNLIDEEIMGAVKLENLNEVTFDISPFEIKTLKLEII